MKTQVLIYSIAILVAGTQFNLPSLLHEKKSAQAQSVQNTEFAFFRVHKQGKTATVSTWGVTSVDGVVSFSIQRTYQDPTDPYSIWEEVGTKACEPSRSFKFTDETVLPAQMYYRIVALQADGTTVTSPIEGVRILSH